MKCPICEKKVAKGRQHAHKRLKLRMMDGTPRLIHAACCKALPGIKRINEHLGNKEWKGIRISSFPIQGGLP